MNIGFAVCGSFCTYDQVFPIMEKLAEEHPEDVTIRHRNKDGSIVATIPVRYIKISAPRQMSDEQKEICAERLRAMREK